MHTYRQLSEQDAEYANGNRYEVGYWLGLRPEWHSHAEPQWQRLSLHKTEQWAMRHVNFLNGGNSQ